MCTGGSLKLSDLVPEGVDFHCDPPLVAHLLSMAAAGGKSKKYRDNLNLNLSQIESQSQSGGICTPINANTDSSSTHATTTSTLSSSSNTTNSGDSNSNSNSSQNNPTQTDDDDPAIRECRAVYDALEARIRVDVIASGRDGNGNGNGRDSEEDAKASLLREVLWLFRSSINTRRLWGRVEPKPPVTSQDEQEDAKVVTATLFRKKELARVWAAVAKATARYCIRRCEEIANRVRLGR